MNSVKIPLGILQRISEFLADLPEDQLADLAEGRARLAYHPAGSDEVVVPGGGRKRSRSTAVRKPHEPTPATVELLARLDTMRSRDEARSALADLKKAALVDAAKTLSVPGAGKLGMDALRTEIVEATVGRRLDSIAIRGFEGLRP
ncbi:MAG TPA: hypothetical protein VK028_04150 [Micromonosporaceae bacterium]|nr:hypothetical protein [Micromonosporaceae bacterium]